MNLICKEMGIAWEGVKREALNRLGWRSDDSCVGLRQLGATVSYY